MPDKGKFHGAVKNALVNDGWTITHDPLHLKLGKKDLYVDLGAEKLMAAEKNGEKIAVEIKSFSGKSLIEDVEKALGQFQLYQATLENSEPDRILFLAVDEEAFANVFADELGLILLGRLRLKVVVIDIENEVIIEWKN